MVRLTPKASVTEDEGIDGDIIGLDDPCGSLITQVPEDEFKKLGYTFGDKVAVQTGKRSLAIP